MKTTFHFREGCHLRGDAQAVGERLETIRAERRTLTAEIVLADARTAGSPLHPFFEWNNCLAAERYRIDQAGHLIRSVAVVFEQEEPAQPARQVQIAGVEAPPVAPPRAVRAFLPIRGEDGESSYVSTHEAMSDADMRKQVLARAHAELDSVSRKWRELRELGDVFGALDRVGEMLKLPVREMGEGQSQ